MNILSPTIITDAMFGVSSDIAEPAGSEPEWSNASVAYTVGQYVKRSTTRKKYRCLVAHTSAASPAPESDPTRWVLVGFAEYAWSPSSTAYVVGDVVTRNATTRKKYVCIVLHTSSSSPLPEDDPTRWKVLGDAEQTWSGASVAYAVQDVVARTTTHRKYRCAVAHTSAATTLPENDPTRWVDIGPSERYAPFDIYTSSSAVESTSLTYVLSPGYFNAIALYGLQGSQYSFTVRDTPGGTVVYSRSGFLTEDPLGWYEYLFGGQRQLRSIVLKDIPLRPSAEATLTLTAATGQLVGLGMFVLGDYVPLSGGGSWGGTEHGASAEPVTYSYISTAEDGTLSITRRHKATNIRARMQLPRDQADYAVSQLQQVLDMPVAWIATDAQGYAGLTSFGLGSSSVVYDNNNTASIEIYVKGII